MTKTTSLNERKEEIEALVKRVQDGDHDSFAKLYDIFIDPIFRYIYYRVDSSEAEDLTENVFLKVWTHIRKYKPKKGSSFTAWIFRIAHNLIVDYYRSNRQTDSEDLLHTIADDRREHNPIRRTENVLDSNNLKKALKNLNKKYQDIIIYKFLNDLSNSEIAGIMRRSEGSVRILQFRALKALRAELEKQGINYSF